MYHLQLYESYIGLVLYAVCAWVCGSLGQSDRAGSYCRVYDVTMSAQRVTHKPLLINDAAWPAPRLYLNLPIDTHKHTHTHKWSSEWLRQTCTYIHMEYRHIERPVWAKIKTINLWHCYTSSNIQTWIRKHTQTLTHLMHHASKHVRCRAHFRTQSCVDGWGTRAQFGPDILGQYNTQLLSLITLAGTIKPHSTIAHTSQGENLFSLLQRHLSPSWGP